MMVFILEIRRHLIWKAYSEFAPSQVSSSAFSSPSKDEEGKACKLEAPGQLPGFRDLQAQPLKNIPKVQTLVSHTK